MKDRRPSETPEMLDVVGVLDEPTKNGVLLPIVDTDELELFSALLVTAADRATLMCCIVYVVRSNDKLYTTDCPPSATRDIDALYLVAMAPSSRRTAPTEEIVKALRPHSGCVLP